MDEDLEKVGRCKCGYTAYIHSDSNNQFFWVQCSKTDCWIGPVVKTRKDKAISAWKRVMEES